MALEGTIIRSSFSSATDSFQTQSTTRELDKHLDHDDFDVRPISEPGKSLASTPAQVTAPGPDAADTALPQLPPPRPSFSSHSAVRISRASSSKPQRPSAFDNAPAPAATPTPAYNMAGPQVHRRTTSSLKTVMRKIFTRKRRSQTDDLDELGLAAPQEQHETTAETAEHGHGPLAVPARISNSLASKHRDLTQAEIRRDPEIISEASDPTPRRRRSTLPSLVFDDDPETDQQSRYSQHDAMKFSPKRRSRSVNAIRRLVDVPSPVWKRDANRRRGSVPVTASDSEVSLRPATSTSVASAPTASVDTSLSESAAEPEEEESLAPDVNVGYLVNSIQHDDNASLEQRLTTLEVKLIDLEFAIARMQNREPAPAVKEKEKPKMSTRYKHSRKQSADPNSQSHPPVEDHPRPKDDRPLSTSTIRPTPPTIHRLPISCSDSETQTQPLMLTPTPPPAHIPVSVPATDFTGISIEQYSALVTLLRREQSARRNLEAQIGSLQDDVRRLQFGSLPDYDSVSVGPELGSSPPYASGPGTGPGSGTRYPIRSTDSRDFFRWRNGSETEGSSSSSPRVRPRPWPATSNGNGSTNGHSTATGIIAPAGMLDSSDSDWDRSDTSGYPSASRGRRDRSRTRSSRGKWTTDRQVERVDVGGMI